MYCKVCVFFAPLTSACASGSATPSRSRCEQADAGPLTILGDLVHNPTVLDALAAKGIAVAQDLAHVTTSTVMVTAHGTSERMLAGPEPWD